MEHLQRPLRFSIFGSDGGTARTETLDQEIIKIGKLESCQLRIDDEHASRMHAVIEVAEEVSIIDLGTAAGTFVNGERVNKTRLAPGDRIQIGRTVLVVTNAGQAEQLALPLRVPAPLPPPAPRPVASVPACPRCRLPLMARAQAPVTVALCQTCGGLWLDHATLRQAVQLPGAALAIRKLAEDAARRAPLGGVGGVFNVGCPVCGALMERRKHRRTGIVIDLCGEHGTWLDRGEPQRMLDGARSAGGPFRAAPVGEEPSDPLPAHTAPAWMREGSTPADPGHRPPLLLQIVDLLFDLES
jgi:Zn-finger nucleic acid-binding protein